MYFRGGFFLGRKTFLEIFVSGCLNVKKNMWGCAVFTQRYIFDTHQTTPPAPERQKATTQTKTSTRKKNFEKVKKSEKKC